MEVDISELQKDILENKDIISIFYKALAISKKYGLTSFMGWLNSELEGYSNNLESLPTYRIIDSEIFGDSILCGITPIKNTLNDFDEDTLIKLKEVYLDFPINEIKDICERNESYVRFKLEDTIENILLKYNEGFRSIYKLCNISKLTTILEKTKRIIFFMLY